MITMNQLRRSKPYKDLMKDLRSGKKKAKNISRNQLMENAQKYSYLCWKEGNYPSELIMRTLAYYDFNGDQ